MQELRLGPLTAGLQKRRTLPELLVAQASITDMVVTSDEDRSMKSTHELIVLALNSGSSSLKFGLYRVRVGKADPIITGEAEAIGEAMSAFHAKDAQGHSLAQEKTSIPSQQAAVIRITKLLTDQNMPVPQSIGHRIVHGGPQLLEHCRINESVLSQLEAAAVFAPLHMPAALLVIRFAQAHFPGIPQVACFDTSFHAQMPLIARVLPIPRALRAGGVQRYGFHGLSCESIVRQLAGELPSRLIIAHLGNGASVTAVSDGASIDTSMGLTPSGGIIMGSRSGDLDPGVIVYLAREEKLDANRLEKLVDQQSGLLGISGLSADMRALQNVQDSNPDARLAIDMFCYSAAKQVAAMSAVLGGVESLVFTGGIGENDPEVRAEICGRLSSIGVELDHARNLVASDPISASSSRCQVRVLPSQEDEQIAHQTWSLC
jgi:acetate kinase